MKQPKMYKLTTDIYSVVRSAVQYGAAGEEVSIIADHGAVLIVAGSKGRFPVAKNLVETIPSRNNKVTKQVTLF